MERLSEVLSKPTVRNKGSNVSRKRRFRGQKRVEGTFTEALIINKIFPFNPKTYTSSNNMGDTVKTFFEEPNFTQIKERIVRFLRVFVSIECPWKH